MDFDLSNAQQKLLSVVSAVVADTGGIERARAISNSGGYDDVLDNALASALPLDDIDLLDRALVAESLAELGTATTFGMRAVLSCAIELPPGAVSVAEYHRSGPVRYAAVATSLVVLNGASARVVPADAARPVAVRSSFGFPYARVDRDGLPAAGTGADGRRLVALWRLAAAAEISGNASAALSRTASYLRERRQFGQTLSSFQALRHRFAEVAVTTEATRWLVRDAAFRAEARGIDLAATYAADAAAQAVPELAQMCGARSFTLEFGLQVFTMRLAGLRLELGGTDRLAQAVLAHGDRETDPTTAQLVV